MIESVNDALIACVKACGGSKQVGPRLWPEKTPDAAQRMLLDCLNDDRPQHLNPEQVMLVLRMARDKGFHAGMDFIVSALSYAPTTPVEPEDERAALQRQFLQGVETMSKLAARLEKMGPPPPVMRAVA